jgi:hypothetical protein
VLSSCEEASQSNVSALTFPLIFSWHPEPANRLVIATAGQRHRHAERRPELEGADRQVLSIFSHPPLHNLDGGGGLYGCKSVPDSQSTIEPLLTQAIHLVLADPLLGCSSELSSLPTALENPLPVTSLVLTISQHSIINC